MIRIDRKVISAILRLTDNYHDELSYDPSSSSLNVIQNYHSIIRSVKLSIDPEEVTASLARLTDLGYIEVLSRWFGGYSFCMTARLKHRHAFWLDSFTKRFWGGFVSGLLSGIIVTALGGLLLSFLRVKLGI